MACFQKPNNTNPKDTKRNTLSLSAPENGIDQLNLLGQRLVVPVLHVLALLVGNAKSAADSITYTVPSTTTNSGPYISYSAIPYYP